MKNSEGLWCPLLALSRFRIVPGVEVVRVGWTIAGNFDNYSFGVRARKVIVTYATRFRVHASRGKRLQRLGIEMMVVVPSNGTTTEMIAIAEVPLPRNNCCYAIVPV